MFKVWTCVGLIVSVLGLWSLSCGNFKRMSLSVQESGRNDPEMAKTWQLLPELDPEGESRVVAAVRVRDDTIFVLTKPAGYGPGFQAKFICLGAPFTAQVKDLNPLDVELEDPSVFRLSDDRLLAIGGFGGADLAQLYSVRENRWLPLKSMGHMRRRSAYVVLEGGRIVAIGGYSAGTKGDRTYCLQCEVYEPEEGVWREAGELVVGRAFPKLGVLADGRVLVCGGVVGAGLVEATAACEVWSPEGGKCERAGRMSTPRVNHALVTVGMGNMIAIGGQSRSNGESLNSCEIYDGVGHTWKAAGEMKHRRFFHDAVEIGSHVIVAGGLDTTKPRPSECALDTVELLDQESKEWIIGPALKIPRGRLFLITVESGIVAVGGNQPRTADLPFEMMYTSPEVLYYQRVSQPFLR